jgi:two-component system chemotaxis sensor kinase CheA
VLHTLKGNCAVYGVLSLSVLCHDVETNMAEEGGLMLPSDLARIEAAWAQLSTTLTQIIGDEHTTKVELADEEYAAIVDSIARGTPRREILTAIAKWRLEPSKRRLTRFAEQAKSMGLRLGKEIDVTLEPEDVRLCAETWAPIWRALTHVLRNAVDHGLESPEERVQKGKRAKGQLRLRTGVKAGRVFIEISDDGRGIDWQMIAARAKQTNLPHATRGDLLEAILADGFSTRDVVTESSGRGVGMSAVREACGSLGGSVEIDSESANGTTVRCSFPESVMNESILSSVSARPITDSLAPEISESGPWRAAR